jgi:hypothetical protein
MKMDLGEHDSPIVALGVGDRVESDAHEVRYVGHFWQLRMTPEEARQVVDLIGRNIRDHVEAFEEDDDDLDEIADHDQQVWDIRETAKELTLHLLRQSDMPSVMNDDAFATAIAERAVFLAKAMHAKLPARNG